MVNIRLKLPENFFETEDREGYLVSHEMKEIWAIELDLLNEFIRVCKKHSIRFFADGGTMLGAVRHGGFIPWDNDIDIVMLREDYEKLDRIAADEFQFPYFWQTERTDPGSMRGHAQLRNSETTGILNAEKDKHYKFNQGIFIDIFPLDYVPENLVERQHYFNKISNYRKKAMRHAFYTSRYTDKGRGIKRCVRRMYHKCITAGTIHNRAYDKFEKFLMMYGRRPTPEVGKLFFHQFFDNCIWKREWFEESKEMSFEMLQIPVSVHYNEIMTAFFGDWRTPVRGESSHGDVFFDVNRPYTEYITRNSK